MLPINQGLALCRNVTSAIKEFDFRDHPEGLNAGYWLVHPHKNELVFLADNLTRKKWKYKVDSNQLVLEADNGERLTFERITEFPE